MTNALAALGILALLVSGELTTVMAWTISLGLAGVLLMPARFQDNPRLRAVGVGSSVVLLVVQVVRLASGGEVLPIAVEFAAFLQVIRLATRQGAAHDQQVVLLSLLHLIAGTVLGSGLSYGICFIGFLVVAPGALVLSHLRREVEGNYRQGAKDRTGLPVDVPRILRSRRVISRRFLAFTCALSVPVFLFTAILFVLFPRVGLSLLLIDHQRGVRMIGFSDRADLGSVGTLRSDPTIAMRVYVNGEAENEEDRPDRLALYMRGTAFDSYDGKSWKRSSTAQHPATHYGEYVRIGGDKAASGSLLMTVELEPISPPVIFLPSNSTAIRLLSQGAQHLGQAPVIWRRPEGEYKYITADTRGLRYEVYAYGPSGYTPAKLDREAVNRYLTLPSGMPQRIADLARSWVPTGASVDQAAAAVEKKLRENYTYDLGSPSGATQNPLDHFLFESKRGHCEYYSTAMAVMLRTLGIAARNVTGFVGGTYNRFGGFYAVRQGDAHSWVEVYTGRGWQRFDPTPPSDASPLSDTTGFLAFLRDVVEAGAQRWDRHVVGYDLKQQMQLVKKTPFQLKEGESFKEARQRWGRWIAGGLVGVVALMLLARALRRLRKRPPTASGPDAATREVMHLYELLDLALAAKGIPRPVGTPPWAHSVGLSALGHPLAKEIADLTLIYQEARFGGRRLSAEELMNFKERVRQVRAATLPSQQAA